MSTIPSKYVPHRLRAHNSKNIEHPRDACIPIKYSSGVLQSSICLAEKRHENRPDVLMHSIKELDYDVTGRKLLEDELALKQKSIDKEGVQRLIKDMRSKHFDLGTDESTGTSVYGKDFVSADSSHLHDNKANLVRFGSDMGMTKVLKLGTNTGYFVSDMDRNNWGDQTLHNTKYKNDYRSPGDQLVQNKAVGRDILLDSHHKTRQQLRQERLNSPQLSDPNLAMQQAQIKIQQECKDIKNDMVRSHFFLGDDPDTLTTTHNREFIEREPDKNDSHFGAKEMGTSTIVLGHQSVTERMDDYNTVYSSELCQPAQNRDLQSQANRPNARDDIKKRMNKTSVTLGSDEPHGRYTSQYKGEFRPITYIKP